MRLPTLLLLASACAVGPSGQEPVGLVPPGGVEARAEHLYPTLAELYGGEQGVRRGCAPRPGVCHSQREPPELGTLDDLIGTIGRPCQREHLEPSGLHDLCEPEGDRLELAPGLYPYEMATLRPLQPRREELPMEWLLTVREPLGALPPHPAPRILRRGTDGTLEPFVDLGAYAPSLALDRRDPQGRTLRLSLPSNVLGWTLSLVLSRAGVPADEGAIRLGDANGNGRFGADLGGRLVRPGAPERSYLMVRLVDPTAGPLMPTANCCAFGLAAVRALWCWIAGLEPSGTGALRPIPYERCPPLPRAAQGLRYPEPGPGCETRGPCPPRIL
ncbi:MAG: hypothetical protein RMK29_14730 [Myxococcales bacterium]|nr:hypothetical protein [Myxococcota bacterium]MDW8282968.1 hypothetical protein [Myxococcales bacterium]